MNETRPCKDLEEEHSRQREKRFKQPSFAHNLERWINQRTASLPAEAGAQRTGRPDPRVRDPLKSRLHHHVTWPPAHSLWAPFSHLLLGRAAHLSPGITAGAGWLAGGTEQADEAGVSSAAPAVGGVRSDHCRPGKKSRCYSKCDENIRELQAGDRCELNYIHFFWEVWAQNMNGRKGSALGEYFRIRTKGRMGPCDRKMKTLVIWFSWPEIASSPENYLLDLGPDVMGHWKHTHL